MSFSFLQDPGQYIAKINATNFENIALDLFQYQYEHNGVYHQWVDQLGIDPQTTNRLEGIPFLPISFFKSHEIVTGSLPPGALFFESSGTTGSINSRHYVSDQVLYRESLIEGFRACYGDPQDWAILALLPSYLERQNASLVYMARTLMDRSQHPANGFFLNEWDTLASRIESLEAAGQPVLLLGVSFALIDFAEKYPKKLEHTIVMETGGMKGRREEWTRKQLHDFLKAAWKLDSIHSEYGMTELLSQAYAPSNGIFQPSRTMKVLVRDLNDPLEVNTSGSGALNMIDLANVHSCAFIAAEDLGTVYKDGCFEVLGRMDHSALRGCSLMAV